MIGRVLTRYKILEEVGQGGMAVVYKGLDTSLGREVAVKVLHPHLAGHKESRDRLEREAQAVAKLRHENILEIFDYSGPDSVESFIVTEFIHGPTLTAFLKDHPIELPEAAAMIASEVARALEHAHGLGVIHRDVKPENVMMTTDGLLKLTDFGIAQIVDKERMTVTGQLLGSPAYMSPEHVEGGRIDFRTDVFACGILSYQLATGVLPFRGKNPHEVLKKIADCQFVPPDQVNPLVSAPLARIITRALSRSPDARHPDVGVFRAELCAELSSVGIDDPRAELKRYFAAPEEWARTFRPKLVAALVENGKKLAARGKRAAALASWSRALTVEPSHAEARSLIDSLGQRRRHVRLAAGVCGLLVVASGTAAAIHFALPSLNARPDGGAAVMQTHSLPAPTPTTIKAPPPSVHGPSPTLVTSNTIRPRQLVAHPPVAPVVPNRMLKIGLVQKKFQVMVDDKLRDGYYEGPIELAPGDHELILKNAECCSDLAVHVKADQVEISSLKLPWKSGYVQVNVDPSDADIAFFTDADAKEQPAGNPRLTVGFPSTFDRGEMNVHVTVRKAGYKTKEVVCRAKAAQTKTCDVEMQKAD